MATLPSTEVKEIQEEDTTFGTSSDFGSEVIVHNCDCHTYQQVITLFCRYIPNTSPEKAFELAWRIDHQGSAQVYSGEPKMANEIAKKLVEGGLRAEVR